MYKEVDMNDFKTNPNFRWFLERKNFFSKDECQEIMDLVDKEAELRSGYHRGTENRDTLGKDDKNSCILNIRTNNNPEILNKFWNAIQLADLTTYHYNCKGIYNNRVQCHRYDVGQYYNPHADFHWLDEYSTNKLTLIVFLNDDYEGGEFHFFDGKVIEPEAGKLIIHPTFAGHGVKRVTKGNRYSCVAWGVGDTFV